MKLVSMILASLVVLATSTRVIVKEPPSPAPSADCSTIIYDMMDCISFLSDGSTDRKPSSSCCTGLESVLSADPQCLCVAIKSSGDMGIDLNLTRAAALPKACGLSAPPLSKCDIPNPPGAAPGKAPSHSPAEPPSESPDTPPSESPDSPPSGAPQPAAAVPSPAEDVALAPAPNSGASHSVPAIPIFLISLLLLTFNVGLSFLA